MTSAPAGPGNSGTGSAQHSGAHGATDGSGHPGHIPLTGTGHSGKHGLQEAALGLRAYRQQLIASNIANADTPGYKAVDIDFQEALNLALSGSGTKPLSLAATAPGPVSYTHLGLLLSCHFRDRIVIRRTCYGQHLARIVEALKQTEKIMRTRFLLILSSLAFITLSACTSAVSYTHLDVYKR